MIVSHRLIVDCRGVRPSQCSDAILVKLGHGPAFALRADTPLGVVHGSVSIAHHQPPEPHVIVVEVYERIERPNDRHTTTLVRPTPMPSRADITTRLDT